MIYQTKIQQMFVTIGMLDEFYRTLISLFVIFQSNDNLQDKKVIRDVNMSKLNNEDVIEVACVFGEEIHCLDCHWI
jgi:hypothetical protein